MNVKDAVRNKRAVRLYTDEAVPDEDIKQILDTARWSQSSKNTQPWQFVVVRNRETLQNLSTAGIFTSHVAQAAFVVVLVSDDDLFWRGFDLGQVAANMQLIAWEMGIGSCPVAFQDSDKAKEILGVPAEKALHAAVTFGYPSPDHKPAQFGGRKPVDETLHWDQW